MKLSDYVVHFLADLGLKKVFVTTGGYAVNLIDSLHKEPRSDFSVTVEIFRKYFIACLTSLFIIKRMTLRTLSLISALTNPTIPKSMKTSLSSFVTIRLAG